jgi:predicted amidohydrolase
MKIALCQLNTITGNIAHNTRRIVEELRAAAAAGARLAVFPEMAITGYPPKDLLEYGHLSARRGRRCPFFNVNAGRSESTALPGQYMPTCSAGRRNC